MKIISLFRIHNYDSLSNMYEQNFSLIRVGLTETAKYVHVSRSVTCNEMNNLMFHMHGFTDGLHQKEMSTIV